MPIKPSIAVIDGDEAFRDDLIALLRGRDFIAKGFPTAEDFLASTRLSLTTCVIAEIKLAGLSGLELYGQLVARGTRIPTILLAAHPDEQTRTRAMSAGVVAYLSKPFSESALLDSISQAAGLHSPAKR